MYWVKRTVLSIFIGKIYVFNSMVIRDSSILYIYICVVEFIVVYGMAGIGYRMHLLGGQSTMLRYALILCLLYASDISLVQCIQHTMLAYVLLSLEAHNMLSSNKDDLQIRVKFTRTTLFPAAARCCTERTQSSGILITTRGTAFRRSSRLGGK